MTLKTWLIIAAVLYAGFGLGLLLAPAPFMAVYGVTLEAGGTLMARILGSALLGFALAFLWSRDGAEEDARPLLRASFLYNIADVRKDPHHFGVNARTKNCVSALTSAARGRPRRKLVLDA